MKRFRKLTLTITALCALAVGGAAFAQAQNSGSSPPAGQSREASTPGDPADTPSAEGRQESNGQAGEVEDGGSEGKAEKAASGRDLPEGPNDQPDSAGQETGD
jgi:hypothetical protein